jgi:hypothetical protein
VKLAESGARASLGVVAGGAAHNEILDPHRDVRLDLFAHFVLERGAPWTTKAKDPASHCASAYAGAERVRDVMSDVTASLYRSHVAVCALRCTRPAGVST